MSNQLLEEKKHLSRREKRKLAQGKKSPQNTSLKIIPIRPLTNNQRISFEDFQNDQHLFLHGCAGTGKSFISLYLALNQILGGFSEQNKLIIIRSAVPSRDIGFLPGNIKEKIKEFENPYIAICQDLFGRGDAYSILKSKNILEFISTSFVRGITLDNSIILLEEIQNWNFHEASSVLTRVGKNCRVIITGDLRQSDLVGRERTGLPKLISVIKSMQSFSFVEFGIEDIVRSAFVKSFLLGVMRYEDKCLNTNSSPAKLFHPSLPNGVDYIKPQ